jgi:hypothetical protein
MNLQRFLCNQLFFFYSSANMTVFLTRYVYKYLFHWHAIFMSLYNVSVFIIGYNIKKQHLVFLCSQKNE